MADAEKGQVNTSAAQVYEEFFVPALFAEWPARLLEIADLGAGDSVLDVGCGTGVLARYARQLVGPDGVVVGLDPNDGMLSVARAVADEVEWHAGRAEDLPFADGSFDAVVSQFAMMFFEDRERAAREMARVCRRGGRVVVAVWASLEDTPGYHAVTELLRRLFGQSVASAMRAPFNMGDPALIAQVFEDAGLDGRVQTVSGRARFDSIDAWVQTDIKGWTLADMLDAAQFEQLRAEAQRALGEFVTDAGHVEFASPAHLIVAEVS